MLNIKTTKHVDRFLLSTTGMDTNRANEDCARLSAILSDPCVRVVEIKDEKETEKTANDKGIIVSFIERLYRLVTYEKEAL
jgi:hypothetical protein